MSRSIEPSEAGPSRNPVKLLVKTRDPSSSTSGDLASNVKASLARKSEQVRKAEKWGDRMMEETLSPKDFKRGIKYITPTAYSEIEHERHLNHLCSYPLCSNPPRDEFRQGARYAISTTRRSIKEVQGNREDGFCSRICMERSMWVAKQLDRRRELSSGDSSDWNGEITLLEEMSTPAPDLPPDVGAEGSTTSSRPLTLRPGARLKGTSLANGSGSVAASAAGGNKPIGVSKLESLVGDITIHERPTPVSPPRPPSLSPQPSPVSLSKTIAPSATQPMATSSAPAKAALPSRRGGSAMVATPTKLVSSILSSSRGIPSSQLPEDSDESESSVDPDEENPLGMGGWSEDEDVRALFEEARAARELMGQAGKDEHK